MKTLETNKTFTVLTLVCYRPGMQTWMCIRWLTNEKNGKGNEEQEHMGNQVKGIHEAAIVQHVTLDFIGREILVAATERPLHATSLQIHTNLESLYDT